MSKTFLEYFTEEVERKKELAERIHTQMNPDHSVGKITNETVRHIRLAKDSFVACGLHLKDSNYEDAIYLFSRGCWNLGEAMGRARLENPKDPT